MKLRFKVQRETNLQAEYENLHYQLDRVPDSAGIIVSKMLNYEKKLDALPQEVWDLERIHSTLTLHLGGTMKHALFAQLHNITWHLSTWPVMECAGVVGCCARGCCTTPRSESRPNHAGHCTLACLYCEQGRGLELIISLEGCGPSWLRFHLGETDWNSYEKDIEKVDGVL
ncbi:uncharacterized protein BDW43DRAFT_263394 [Aspergillus alliaceus]|uniref:uncharacterized protein n=1 Tax=Petromyces alliaceus TaxID=209559 RepID=UPI0012A76878|nr:uncharacterized protein BDW43DRAFT_263394 [Aspergillus alliaceus]KAB8238273.1 hypothetical protein BDW43DRAFT_263394 [Aspergillus alliaceus]